MLEYIAMIAIFAIFGGMGVVMSNTHITEES